MKEFRIARSDRDDMAMELVYDLPYGTVVEWADHPCIVAFREDANSEKALVSLANPGLAWHAVTRHVHVLGRLSVTLDDFKS